MLNILGEADGEEGASQADAIMEHAQEVRTLAAWICRWICGSDGAATPPSLDVCSIRMTMGSHMQAHRAHSRVRIRLSSMMPAHMHATRLAPAPLCHVSSSPYLPLQQT